MIIDGAGADAFIVVARTNDGEPALFMVNSSAKGVSLTSEFFWMLEPMLP